MASIASLIFRLVQYPHQGKIITIDQLELFNPNSQTNADKIVPLSGQSHPQYEHIVLGLFKDSSLLGVFPLPFLAPPHLTTSRNMLSCVESNQFPCSPDITASCHYEHGSLSMSRSLTNEMDPLPLI